MQKYDIIGDIHGYASQLKALLSALGYTDADGIYRHPDRRVIFLGDYIDRGPEIRQTLQIVRGMVEGGSALAIMGNHEFNALAYATPDGAGDYLRKHTAEKIGDTDVLVSIFCKNKPWTKADFREFMGFVRVQGYQFNNPVNSTRKLRRFLENLFGNTKPTADGIWPLGPISGFASPTIPYSRPVEIPGEQTSCLLRVR